MEPTLGTVQLPSNLPPGLVMAERMTASVRAFLAGHGLGAWTVFFTPGSDPGRHRHAPGRPGRRVGRVGPAAGPERRRTAGPDGVPPQGRRAGHRCRRRRRRHGGGRQARPVGGGAGRVVGLPPGVPAAAGGRRADRPLALPGFAQRRVVAGLPVRGGVGHGVRGVAGAGRQAPPRRRAGGVADRRRQPLAGRDGAAPVGRRRLGPAGPAARPEAAARRGGDRLLLARRGRRVRRPGRPLPPRRAAVRPAGQRQDEPDPRHRGQRPHRPRADPAAGRRLRRPRPAKRAGHLVGPGPGHPRDRGSGLAVQADAGERVGVPQRAGRREPPRRRG